MTTEKSIFDTTDLKQEIKTATLELTWSHKAHLQDKRNERQRIKAEVEKVIDQFEKEYPHVSLSKTKEELKKRLFG